MINGQSPRLAGCFRLSTVNSGDLSECQLTVCFRLNAAESLQVTCLKCDLTGTMVSSTHHVAVFSGGEFTQVRTRMTQLTLPMFRWCETLFLVMSHVGFHGIQIVNFKRTLARMHERARTHTDPHIRARAQRERKKERERERRIHTHARARAHTHRER